MSKSSIAASAGLPPGVTEGSAKVSPSEPSYARPLLAAITVLAAVLFFWNISSTPYHPFYAETVRSMASSWKGFFFGSFDPGNSITIDKLPGFLWPQALSVRIFGFHGWAIAIPQALEGVIAVLVVYRATRRWAGTHAALLASFAFTVTPVIAGLFRTPVEDPAFTLLLLLAADATVRAIKDNSPARLLLAGVWVAAAFQTKMVEAWAVLPALALGYLVAARTTLRRRLVHVVLAGLVTVVLSASWVMAVSLTPAKDRPYVDGTTNNSPVSMVIGYNFLNRFSSLGVNAANTGSVTATSGMQNTASKAAAESSGSSLKQEAVTWLKLLGPSLAPQTGWLYPIAAVSAVFGVHSRRRKPRTDLVRAGYLIWSCWLATFFLALTAGSVAGHVYYMGVIGTPLAILTGAGIMAMWRAYRAGGRKAVVLPVTFGVTVLWEILVTQMHPTFRPWLAPVLVVSAVGAALLLWRGRTGKGAGRRTTRAGLLVSLAALLLAPAPWTFAVFQAQLDHSGMGNLGPVKSSTTSRSDTAGTRTTDTLVASTVTTTHTKKAAKRKSRAIGRNTDGQTTYLTKTQRDLLDYTERHRDGARFVFATPSWVTASPYIMAKAAPVLPMGGFTGEVPQPTVTGFQQMVRSGEVRYVLLGAVTRAYAHSTSPTAPPAKVSDWVKKTCHVVPPSEYARGAAPFVAQTLYLCERGAAH